MSDTDAPSLVEDDDPNPTAPLPAWLPAFWADHQGDLTNQDYVEALIAQEAAQDQVPQPNLRDRG